MASSEYGSSQDVETDHVYDGIQEFDNPMPRWWLLTFYGAIVFAIGYWFYFQTSGVGLSQLEAYDRTMEEANAALAAVASNISEEDLLALAQDPAVVSKGMETFTANCTACHAAGGVGLVGPNLTDDYWVHGGSAGEIYKIIGDGVLAKGMPAWSAVLGPTSVQEVTAYVLSIKGQNLPGKAPEGVNAAGEPAPAAK